MSGPRAEAEGPLIRWDGEPIEVWEAAWEVPRVEAWARVGSTNDRARHLAREGARPFTVVLAEEQTAGRGREERAWSSPAGLGLWMSVVLKDRAPESRRLAPLLVGLAVCRAVEQTVPGVSAALKWPNDVLIGGRKVCGVLCEAAGDTLVVGMGVNVRQTDADFPEEIRGRAVSLDTVAGRRVSRGALGGRVLDGLRTVLERATSRLDGPLGREVRDRDALEGLRVAVKGGARGVARGIDAEGALLVAEEGEGRGGTRRVLAGTVRIVEELPANRRDPSGH